MNDQMQQIFDVATGVVNGIFATMEKPDVYFKQNIELEPDGSKNLLVVGSIYRDYNDGHCIAVLNPDARLAGQLKGGVGYSDDILKYMAKGRCDAMAMILCRGRKPYVAATYLSRKK